jgi:AcrR family transcriptional regulator
VVFTEFERSFLPSTTDICQEVFEAKPGTGKIKKEKTLHKNLLPILEAALALSNEKGFTAMSMRDLSRRTGLSMGALYAYFSSKDELLDMLWVIGGTMLHRSMDAALVGLTDPADRLRAAIRTHLYVSEALRPWFFFSYMEAKNLSRSQKQTAQASELASEKLFTDILDQGCETGFFSHDDSNMTAAAIKAMLQDWYVKRWKYSRRKITVDEYAEFVIGFVESHIRDKTPTTRG